MNVSICIATYNGDLFIREQLDSIITQIEKGDEIIIADDCSCDFTVNILNQYTHLEYVTILPHPHDNLGLIKNFERAITNSNNEIIILADQDDVWLPGRLDKIKFIFNNNKQLGLIMMNGLLVDSNLCSKEITIFDLLKQRHGFFNNFMKNNFVGCGMAFRRKILQYALPIPKNTPWHDWYIGLLAELTTTIFWDSEVSFLYRRHNYNNSPTGKISNNSFFRKIYIRIFISISIFIAIIRYILIILKSKIFNQRSPK